jgi:hypothetical protein
MSTWIPPKTDKPEFQKYLQGVAVDYSRRRLGLVVDQQQDAGSESGSHRTACEYLRTCKFHPSAKEQTDLVAIVRPGHAMTQADYQEDVLRESVARFCAEYFSLAVDVRKERWEQLWNAVEKLPALRWRLDQLRTALSISPEKLEAIGQSRASVFTDPFVMSPEQSAQSGRTTVASLIGNRAAIAAAVRTLKDDRLHCDELAELKPSCGVTAEQRLQWLGARAKHKRPLKSSFLIISLLLVIFGAFASIPITTARYPRGGQPITRPPASAPSPSPQRQARFLEDMSPDLRRRLLGPEKAAAFEEANERLKAAEEKLRKLEEAKEKSSSQTNNTGSKVVNITEKMLESVMKAAREKAAANSGGSAEADSPDDKSTADKRVPRMFVKDKDGNMVPLKPEVAEQLQKYLEQQKNGGKP